MSNVSLTSKQQKFFSYFNEYQKNNGVFPTLSQAGRDMKCCPATISSMYGALLLKGAFTDGKALTAGNKPRRTAVAVKPVNVLDMKIEAKKNVRRRYTPRVIAEQLSKLIASGNPAAKELADMLGL